jgi:hypothetical protein
MFSLPHRFQMSARILQDNKTGNQSAVSESLKSARFAGLHPQILLHSRRQRGLLKSTTQATSMYPSGSSDVNNSN